MGYSATGEAVLLGTEAAAHGFDDIGALQPTGTITATAQAGGRWTGKTIITSADHGLKQGAPIVISDITAYAGPTRVLRVIDEDRFVINKDFDSENEDDDGSWAATGGESAWAAFMPIGADLAGSDISELTFYNDKAQGGDQNVQTYAQDRMYYFPGIIKTIDLSAGNVRLFRHATLNPGGADLT